MAHDLGDVVPLSAEVRNPAGQLANAGNMRLEVTLPVQTLVVVDPVAPTSTGIYDHNFVTTLPGWHPYRWVATGANAGAQSDGFDVRAANPPYIMSLAAAKNHINLPATVTKHDEELRGFIEAATRMVEKHPKVGVGPIPIRTITERHHVHATPKIMVFEPPIHALTSVTAVLTGGTSPALVDLVVDKATGTILRLDGCSFTGGPWDVVYQAGRAFILANWVLAAKEIVRHLWRTQRGGTTGGLRAGGEEETWEPGFAFSIPRRALELLETEHGPLGP